jgi:hypothetical protein
MPPAQWAEFDTTLAALIGAGRFAYILTDDPIN